MFFYVCKHKWKLYVHTHLFLPAVGCCFFHFFFRGLWMGMSWKVHSFCHFSFLFQLHFIQMPCASALKIVKEDGKSDQVLKEWSLCTSRLSESTRMLDHNTIFCVLLIQCPKLEKTKTNKKTKNKAKQKNKQQHRNRGTRGKLTFRLQKSGNLVIWTDSFFTHGVCRCRLHIVMVTWRNNCIAFVFVCGW